MINRRGERGYSPGLQVGVVICTGWGRQRRGSLRRVAWCSQWIRRPPGRHSSGSLGNRGGEGLTAGRGGDLEQGGKKKPSVISPTTLFP